MTGPLRDIKEKRMQYCSEDSQICTKKHVEINGVTYHVVRAPKRGLSPLTMSHQVAQSVLIRENRGLL